MIRPIEQILAERGKEYGSFEDNAATTQKLCSVALDFGLNLENLHKEAIHMVMHKISRIVCGNPNHIDSWQDISGYAQCVVNALETRAKDAELARINAAIDLNKKWLQDVAIGAEIAAGVAAGHRGFTLEEVTRINHLQANKEEHRAPYMPSVKEDDQDDTE